MAKGKNYYLFVAFIAAFGGILFGYDTGVISGAILFIKNQFHLTEHAKGFAVAAVLYGCLIGAIVSGRLADRYGRKRMLIIDSIIFIIGTIMTAFSDGLTSFMISRFIVGIAIGISSYTGPLYISEISPVKYRGALVSLNQLAISVGIFVSYIVDYIFAAHGAWRWMFGVGVIPAFVLLLGTMILPHSPRWILSRGDEEQAMSILNKIHGHNAAIENEFELIKASLKQQKGNWRMLFSKLVRPTVMIGAGLAIIQQITGINTILYYAPTIFTMAGFHSAQTAILATMGVGAIFVIFSIVALPLIDTLGRRPLLFIGMVLMAVALLAMSISFHAHGSEGKLMPFISITSMLVYIAGFAISLGPVMWLMIAEIFPLKVRGIGSSFATAVNWGSNAMVANIFPLLIVTFSIAGTFSLFFVINLLSIIFIYLFVPETKGVSLEQIEANLYAGKQPRDLGAH